LLLLLLLQDYAERVLPSIIQETLKSVVAQYNAAQLITMREVRCCFGLRLGV
jgi:regulator of protease activity HflC (stomatin/prohibitin superfamily)